MQITHHDAFATRLWLIDLSHLSQHYDEWRSEIQKLRDSDMEPRGKSNRMGWNSQPMLFGLSVFKPLFVDCIAAFNYAIKTVSPQADYHYHIEAWANINDPGSFNTVHNHPRALMSGVFYLSTPLGSGQLVFRDPRPGAMLSPFPPSNAPNAASRATLTPKEGMLAIFPNWLEHHVEPHQGTIPRISIAMNAIQALALAQDDSCRK